MKRSISTFIAPVLFAVAVFAVTALTTGCIKDSVECVATGRDQLTLTIAIPASVSVATYATEPGSSIEDNLDKLFVTIRSSSGFVQNFTVSMSGVTGALDASGHRIFSTNIPVPKDPFYANDNIAVMANYAEPPTLTAPPIPSFFMSGVGRISGTAGNLTASVHLVRGVAKIRTGVTFKDSKIALNGDVSVKILHVPTKIRTYAPYPTHDGYFPGEYLSEPSGLTYIDYASNNLSYPTAFSESFTRSDGSTGKAWPQYVYENWLEDESTYVEQGTGANVTTLEVTMPLVDRITGQTKSYVKKIPIRTPVSDSPSTYFPGWEPPKPDDPTAFTYRIKRNHIYTVDIRVISFETVKVNVDILPWKDDVIETDVYELAIDALPDPIFLPRNASVRIVLNESGGQSFAKLDSNVPAGYSIVGADPETGIVSTNSFYVISKNSLLPAGITFIVDNVRYKTNLQVKGEVVLEVSGNQSFPRAGGNGALSVKSCIRYYDGTVVPLPWITEYSTDGGITWSSNGPSWLTGLPASDPGGLSAKSYSYTVLSAPNLHTAALKSAAPVTNYDLSTNGGTTLQNTANCYLVNAPGSYRLPLVYGNAIKGGATNSSAYTSTASCRDNSIILKKFIDHENNPISDPHITARYTPSDCCLVWQDADGLLSNVHLSTDGRYLEFEVPQAGICEGNAVVAVRDASNRIMWSWHIWVTDYVLGTGLQPTTNYQNKTYYFLPYNIGWCKQQIDFPTTPAVSVLVRIVPDPTLVKIEAPTATISRDIAYAQNVIPGNCPYFQWGRKDPMLPSISLRDGEGSYNKPVFTGSGYTCDNSNLSTALKNYILNPHLFNTNESMDNKYFNLWSANNNVTTPNDDPVIKTIYDPSPVGFCMPPSNAWSGFTTTGKFTSNISEIRGTWDNTVTPEGYKFNINVGDAYYPALGYRHSMSKWDVAYYVDGMGLYWSAIPTSVRNSHNISFRSGIFSPQDDSSRYLGLPVRPVHE